MKRKLVFGMIAILFFCSISINIYFFFTQHIRNSDSVILINNKTKVTPTVTIKDSEGEVSSEGNPAEVYATEDTIKKESKEDVLKDNPIDKFFDEYEMGDYSNATMGGWAILYSQLWKAEMNHAYELIINAAHKDLRDTLEKSQRLLISYAKTEADIYCAVYVSDAFGDESGELPEDIYYGSDSAVFGNDTVGEIYRNRTKELFEYCKQVGVDIDYIFTEKSIGKYNPPPYKKK